MIPVLMGPTGSGKTSLVAKLNPKLFEVVSVDSRQIYKGLEISSAAPSTPQLSHIQHHLISIIEPSIRFDASIFVERAHQAIDIILKKNKIPILVGGAGFYFRALCSGGPIHKKADLEIKSSVSGMTATSRLALLKKLLPSKLVGKNEQAQGGKIHPNDDYRVSRALEIFLSDQKSEGNEVNAGRPKMEPLYRFQGWWLHQERTVYWRRLQLRVEQMVSDGMVDEISGVFQSHGDCPGLQSLGSFDALKFISGKISQKELEKLIFISHRQYGKRQRTWFRKESNLVPIETDSFEAELELFLKREKSSFGI